MKDTREIEVRLEDLRAEMEEAVAMCDYSTAKRIRREIKKLEKRARRSKNAKPRASVKEQPGSTRSVVPFDQLSTEGIMRCDENHYACALEVDDVNYIAAREGEKEDVRILWGDYLNSLDHTIDVSIYMLNKRIGAEEFLESIDMDPVPGDVAGNELRAEYRAYCADQLKGSSRSMRRSRLVVIKVAAPTRAKAADPLAREAARLIRTMRDLESDARVLDGQAWLDRICAYTHPDDEPGSIDIREAARSVDLSVRDLAAPSSLDRVEERKGDSRLILSGRRWVKTFAMTLDGYGNTMRDNFITDLSSLPYDIAIAWHIKPWETAAAISAAENHLFSIDEENNAYKLQRSKPERGYFIDDDNLPSSMRDARAEAQALRDDLVRHDMRNFSVVTVVTAMARDQEELEAACKEIEAVFSAHRKPLPDSWAALRVQSLTTALPIGSCRIPYQRTLTTEPLSHMIMWASAELLDRGGMLMGVNPYTRAFELYDPVAYEHTNSFTFGIPRHGKSMTAKLTRIIQNRLKHPDDDVIIIDPENEYSTATKMLGGQAIDISETSTAYINPLDISDSYGSDNPGSVTNPVPAKVSFIQALVHMMASSVTDVQVNILDQAARYAYSEWLANPKPENVPTLVEIYEFLNNVKGSAAEDAQQLAVLIDRYVTGTLSCFAHRTNVDIKNHLVDFVLSNLSKELKPIAMLVILDHIWVRVTANRARGRRTWLIIDEFQLLLDDEYAVNEFDRFFTRGGKWDLYNHGITQSMSRMLDYQQTRYMLQNCPFVTIMCQTSDAAREAAELFGLSDTQERFIRSASPGQGLHVMKNMVVPFDFTISEKTCPNLYAICTTRAEDVKRILATKRAATATSSEQAPARAAMIDLDEPERTPVPAVASHVAPESVPSIQARVEPETGLKGPGETARMDAAPAEEPSELPRRSYSAGNSAEQRADGEQAPDPEPMPRRSYRMEGGDPQAEALQRAAGEGPHGGGERELVDWRDSLAEYIGEPVCEKRCDEWREAIAQASGGEVDIASALEKTERVQVESRPADPPMGRMASEGGADDQSGTTETSEQTERAADLPDTMAMLADPSFARAFGALMAAYQIARAEGMPIEDALYSTTDSMRGPEPSDGFVKSVSDPERLERNGFVG